MNRYSTKSNVKLFFHFLVLFPFLLFYVIFVTYMEGINLMDNENSESQRYKCRFEILKNEIRRRICDIFNDSTILGDTGW